MKIITFAWTSAALLAGRKTVTRRDWSGRYASQFKARDLVQAYDRNPRNGGKKIAVIRLIQNPYKEQTCNIPDGDYECEGLQWMEEQGLDVNGQTPKQFWDDWRSQQKELWVIRFELVSKEV